MTIPTVWLDNSEESQLQAKSDAYERLKQQHGFTLLMDALKTWQEDALNVLRENGEPGLESSLVNRWRERAALVDAVQHEIEATIANAKEMKYGSRSQD